MNIGKWKFLVPSVCLLVAMPTSASTLHYLDPSLSTIMVDDKQCFKSSPEAILEVHPYTDETGRRKYAIKQVFDKKTQRALYAKSIEEQMAERRFVANKFCRGFLSLSDMDLPMTKGQGIHDANDGLLLTREVRHRVVEVVKNINEMRKLAIKSVDGADHTAFNARYLTLMKAIDDVAENARFEGIHLLNGDIPAVKVPTHKGASQKLIYLMNATTGKQGFNLHATNLASLNGARVALTILNAALNHSMNQLEDLKAVNATLKKDAKLDENVTIIDIRNDPVLVNQKQTQLIMS